jgi:membrane associated rhomboid family serine protease
MMPVTPLVKILLIINVVVWFVGVVVLEQYFLKDHYLSAWLSLVPYDLLKSFFIWQPVTYLFVHSPSPMHIIFNMLLLWWMGSSLERVWGSKFFGLFYFVSGVGAAFLYCIAVISYALISGNKEILILPVFGASSALFGLLVAYGMIFGEQIVYFMFFFPMKAKYFVGILAAIEVVLALNNGPVQGKVSNLACIGGLIAGYVFLKIWGAGPGKPGLRGMVKKSRSSKLRLVVNNEEEFNESNKPKYWN